MAKTKKVMNLTKMNVHQSANEAVAAAALANKRNHSQLNVNNNKELNENIFDSKLIEPASNSLNTTTQQQQKMVETVNNVRKTKLKFVCFGKIAFESNITCATFVQNHNLNSIQAEQAH